MTRPERPVLAQLALLACAAAPLAQGPAAPDAAAEPPAAPTMLQLRDGRILWGRIAEHDAEAISFVRLENGGRVQLPWEFLDPTLGHRLQLEHGYVEPEGEEVLVTADRIPVIGGEDVVGKIVNRTDEALWVKTAGGTLPIPLRRVAGASTSVQVSALEVYTREELHQRKLSEMAAELEREGEAGARAHFAVGEFCERILDFQNALEHYETGARLAPDLRAAEVAAILERLRAKAAHQEQWDYLKDADLLRARRYYARALEKLALFPELYPDSPVLADWERLRAKTLEGQERALREEVAGRWHFWTQRHAYEAARELAFEDAVAWIEGEMSEAILGSVREDLDEIAPDVSKEAVRVLFEEREGGRLQTASYGNGTWLLGEERARALPSEEEEAEEEEAASEKDELRADLRERMRRYVESQRRAARRQQEQGEAPEEYWRAASVHSRRQWIVAYYAEFVGDMDVVRIRLSNCRGCGGTGAKEVLHLGSAKTRDSRDGTSSSGRRLVECPTCHHVGVVRRVQYR